MTYTLYHYKLWPDAQASRIALDEQADAYTLTTVDMSIGEHTLPAFTALNPQQEPPVLHHVRDPVNGVPQHDIVVWEVLAVARYIADVATSEGRTAFGTSDPCILPIANQWAAWCSIHLTPAFELILLHTIILPVAERDPNIAAMAVAMANKALAVLEPAVPDVSAGPAFMARDVDLPDGIYGIADAIIGSTIEYHRLFGQLLPLTGFPRTQAYLTMLEGIPSFNKVFKGVTL